MASNVSEDRLLTAREAGRYLGFAEGTIRNKASRDELPYVKLGRSLRFRRSELDRWIIDQQAATESEAA